MKVVHFEETSQLKYIIHLHSIMMYLPEQNGEKHQICENR
jgi:hypothetical protein